MPCLSLFLLPLLSSPGILACSAGKTHRGLKLIPTQGTSNNGAFLQGVYEYAYQPASFEQIREHGFNAVRLAVNVETAWHQPTLDKLQAYFDAVGRVGIIVMFDDNSNDTYGDGHGDGRVNNATELALAWKNVHRIFASYTDVMYEIFNEPFGYVSATEYLSDMYRVMGWIPKDRCILNGLGYADDIRSVATAGWNGCLAYHLYPMWLSQGNRTQEQFSQLITTHFSGLSSRTYITEFGANLALPNLEYKEYEPSGEDGNVNCLRGLHDAVIEIKKGGYSVKGMYVMHGMHNSDSYDYWDCLNMNGSTKVANILRDFSDDSMSFQYAGRAVSSREACESACNSPQVQNGDSHNDGKLLTTSGECTFTASRPHSGTRYCGAGSAYEGKESVNCSSCACPSNCEFFPCWSEYVSTSDSASPVVPPQAVPSTTEAGPEDPVGIAAANTSTTVAGPVDVSTTTSASPVVSPQTVPEDTAGIAAARVLPICTYLCASLALYMALSKQE